jgi:hypothetical protein
VQPWVRRIFLMGVRTQLSIRDTKGLSLLLERGISDNVSLVKAIGPWVTGGD